MRIALVLRGHVRDSLDDSCLLDFVTELIKVFNDVDIFIHTWKESEAKSSWRKLDRKDVFEVNKSRIMQYFEDVKWHIKNVIIDDDMDIKLFGSVNGNIGGIPKVAWKRMWHGQFSAVASTFVGEYDQMVNIRMDNFHCGQSKDAGLTTSIIMQKLQRWDKHLLIHGNQLVWGCDNVLIGKPFLMWQLVYNFHYCLDEILDLKLPCGRNQEFLVPLFLEKYLKNGVICKQ